MFKIKICGITSEKDAVAAVEAGADAIGLNFYPGSKRFIEQDAAAQIAAVLNPGCCKVGLFVNADPALVQQTADQLQLAAVQLHGDEPPELLTRISHPNILRARRLGKHPLAALVEDLTACKASGRTPQAYLADAAAPGQYGGTGHTLDWQSLSDWRTQLHDVPLILAGGLTPENVAAAIRTVRPHGVDVASGVESSPGVKDFEKMQRFVDAARSAFEAIAPDTQPQPGESE